MINLIWTLNLHPRPNVSRSQFASILPLALAYTMGNLLTNISLGKVVVSFTHTIKAMEPFFTVVLSTLFLGEVGNANASKQAIDASVDGIIVLGREVGDHFISQVCIILMGIN